MIPDLDDLSDRLRAGERRALARAITLVESSHPEHRARAELLLERLLPATGGAIRLGVSGVPGAGKSTFIEGLGRLVIAAGLRIAVLAVDPSSRRSGGSILGDKTRMEELARDPAAFIRPSPAGETLGGVARRTREAALLCEAAGFGVVVVETVGVGQSETAVAEMVDGFLLLLAPGGGDELQGIKRGIVELADLVAVNKADGHLRTAAEQAARDYASALRLLRPASRAWAPEVLTCSALTGEGVPAVWDAVRRHRAALDGSGELAARRARQARSWFRDELGAGLIEAVRARPATRALLRRLEGEVADGRAAPARAAARVIERFCRGDDRRRNDA